MPDVNLELSDAAELAELLTFLTDWLSGSQQQTLADSLDTFVGHPAYDANNLAADLHLLRLPVRPQRRRTTLRRTHTMINTTNDQYPALDRITRITDGSVRTSIPETAMISANDGR